MGWICSRLRGFCYHTGCFREFSLYEEVLKDSCLLSYSSPIHQFIARICTCDYLVCMYKSLISRQILLLQPNAYMIFFEHYKILYLIRSAELITEFGQDMIFFVAMKLFLWLTLVISRLHLAINHRNMSKGRTRIRWIFTKVLLFISKGYFWKAIYCSW